MTVATAEFALDHENVWDPSTFPLLSRAVAVSWLVAAGASVSDVGLTATVATVGGEGTAVTVSVTAMACGEFEIPVAVDNTFTVALYDPAPRLLAFTARVMLAGATVGDADAVSHPVVCPF